MKKLLVVLAFAGVVSPAAFAGNGNSGGDGCGLGWEVYDGKSLVGTSIRGTTNSVVPPTFGMTSGTIGCDQHPIAMNQKQAVEYVSKNYEPLMIQVAQGRGEYVNALASTLNCKDAGFGAVLQQNYSTLSKIENAADFVGQVNNYFSSANLACGI